MLKQVLIITTAAALTTLAPSALAQYTPGTTSSGTSSSTGSSDTTKADRKSVSFIKDAAADNHTEVALAKLGANKAQNQELKSFSEQLQQEHTQANQQLHSIAQKLGVTIEQPEENPREVTKLEKETDPAKFDKKLAELMLEHHQKDIEKFQKASTQLQDVEVKQFAQTTLPKLQQHFQKAQTVAKSVGVEESVISSYARKLPPAVGGTSDHSDDTSKGAGAADDTSKGAGARDLKQDSTSSSGSSSDSKY